MHSSCGIGYAGPVAWWRLKIEKCGACTCRLDAGTAVSRGRPRPKPRWAMGKHHVFGGGSSLVVDWNHQELRLNLAETRCCTVNQLIFTPLYVTIVEKLLRYPFNLQDWRSFVWKVGGSHRWGSQFNAHDTGGVRMVEAAMHFLPFCDVLRFQRFVQGASFWACPEVLYMFLTWLILYRRILVFFHIVSYIIIYIATTKLFDLLKEDCAVQECRTPFPLHAAQPPV